MKARKFYSVTQGPTFYWNRLELPFKRIPAYCYPWIPSTNGKGGERGEVLQFSRGKRGITHIKVQPVAEMNRFLEHQEIKFSFRLEKKSDNMIGSGYTEQSDEEIVAKHWPSLVPLLKWDGFALTGEPPFYLENSKYCWQQRYAVQLQIVGDSGVYAQNQSYALSNPTDPLKAFKSTCFWGCLPGDRDDNWRTTNPEDVDFFPADTMSIQDIGWWLVLRLEALKEEFSRVMTEWGFLPLPTPEEIEGLKKRHDEAREWYYGHAINPRGDEDVKRYALLTSGYIDLE